jgi:hypothetical protein
MKQYEGLPDKWMLFTPDKGEESIKALRILNRLISRGYELVSGSHYSDEKYVSPLNLPPIGIKIFTPTEFLNFGLPKDEDEDRKPVMGDVAVRINGGAGSNNPEGKMYTLHSETAKDNRFCYLNGHSMVKESWRYATKEEKLAFKGGITNINDMVDEVDLEDSVSYGMKVGDAIPTNILNKWKNMDGHYYSNYSSEQGWRNDSGGDSYKEKGWRVLEIKRIKGIHALRVSSVTHVKAEGFKEYLDSFNEPAVKENTFSKGDIVVVVDKDIEGVTSVREGIVSSPRFKTPHESYRIDVLDMLERRSKGTYDKWELSGIEAGKLSVNSSQRVKKGHVPLIEVKRR